MKKVIILFLLLFVIWNISIVSAGWWWGWGGWSWCVADKIITLMPWWNVASTPKLLSWITFSNSWVGISFYTLVWSSWTSVIPTVQTIVPLEGFVVNNSTTESVSMCLIYKTNVSPMEALFQKTLNLWRNILWITTITDPFAYIDWAVRSIDFTKNNSSNLVNWVNSSFTVNNGSSTVTAPELWESYGVFVSSLPAIYGGNQDGNEEYTGNICDTPENVLSCSLGLDTCPTECISAPTSTGNCDISEKSVEFSSGVTVSLSITNTWTNLRNLHTVLNTWELSNLRCDLMTPDSTIRSISSCNGNFTYDGNTTGRIKIWIRYNEVAPTSREGKPNNNSERTYPQWTYNFGNLESCTTPVICNTPENVLACNLGLDTCPVECTLPMGITLLNNSISVSNNIQGTMSVNLASLVFSLTGTKIGTWKLYSFRVDLSWTNWQKFAGWGIIVYNNWVPLVSNTIVSGSSQTITFVLPTPLSITKNSSQIINIRLDQIPVTTSIWDELQLLVNNINAQNAINSDPIGTWLSTVGTKIIIDSDSIATIVNQSYTNKLIQAGSTDIIGSVKIKALNGSGMLGNLHIQLSGLTTIDTAKLSSLKLLKNGVIIFALPIDDVQYIGLGQLINSWEIITYDVQATFANINTSGNLIRPFVTKVSEFGFTTKHNNTLIITGTNISANITPVKSKPIISLVSANKIGNNAVYRINIASNGGDMKLSSTVFRIINNTDTTGTLLTGTLWLGNEGVTLLGVVSANGTATFPNLSELVNIANGTTASFTLIIPVSNRYIWANLGNIGIEINNISYYDEFSDASVVLHSNMFDSYKWDITPVTTLAVIQ